MKHLRLSTFVALALASLAIGPAVLQRWEAWRVLHRLEGLGAVGDWSAASARGAGFPGTPDPALVVRIEEPSGLVASWQTVAGCGAGSGGGSSVGLKWIGRNVTGGLFNVQQQVTYTKLGEPGIPEYPAYNLFFNTLITADIGQKWNVGVNLPIVYKYLVDPNRVGTDTQPATDYTNSGLGDINLLVTRKLGRINSLLLTGILGIPTGVYDAHLYPGKYADQSQQIGFGEVTGSLILDQTLDQMWGLVVLGGSAAWRGGENRIHNYRAPSGTLYGYAGYFLGPLVPACGLSVTEFTGHDKSRDSGVQKTPLFSMAANLSIEWSTSWIALLVAASFPYGYDGIGQDDNGNPRSEWRFFPWTVSFGVAASPF